MIDTITAVATTITAIISVCIAYKSHKTTIEQRNLDKIERSTKIVRLFEGKNRNYFSLLFLLSNKNNFYSEKSTSIYQFIINQNIESMINTHIKTTEEIRNDWLDQLNSKDETLLSNSITKSRLLLIEIERLKKAIDKNNDKEVQKTNKKITEIAKEILRDL